MQKKMMLALFVCAVFAVSGSVGFAGDDADAKPMMPGKVLTRRPMNLPVFGMGSGKTHMETQPDGSVIVLSGTTLIKYDPDLNLVKKTVLPSNRPDLRPGMHCPLCGQKIPAADAE